MASFRVCAPCGTTAFYHPPGAHEHDVLGTIATHVARPQYDHIDLPLEDAGTVCRLMSSRPPLRFDGEHERVDRTGPRLAEQPGDQGERPAGVGPVIDEQDGLPGQPWQRRGDRARHLVGTVNGAEPLRAVRAAAMRRTNVLDAAEVGQPSDP